MNECSLCGWPLESTKSCGVGVDPETGLFSVICEDCARTVPSVNQLPADSHTLTAPEQPSCNHIPSVDDFPVDSHFPHTHAHGRSCAENVGIDLIAATQSINNRLDKIDKELKEILYLLR